MVKPVVPVPVTAIEAPASKPKRNSRRKKANPPEPKLETMLWAAVDKLRGHINAAEYKHLVLGLDFLKYIYYAFEEHSKHLKQQISDPASELCLDKSLDRYATHEDRAEYAAAINYWVPQQAGWAYPLS
jgi:type I restriction enzyme M protein